MKLLKKFSPPESVDSAVISPDNNFIATSNSLVGDIWIMDMQGNLVQTLETELSGASDSNMIIWQDNYIITLADSKTCVYVWDSRDFSLIGKYKAPEKSSIEKIFYQNNILYLLSDPSFIKKSERLQGILLNEPNFFKINLVTQEIQSEIWQNKMLLSGLVLPNEEIIVFGNELIDSEKMKWKTAIFSKESSQEIYPQLSLSAFSCSNPYSHECLVAYKTKERKHRLFLFNKKENILTEKTNTSLEYLALSSYQDSFLCLAFDTEMNSDCIINIKDDTITPLEKEASTAFFVSENKILIGLNNDVYLMEL